MKYKRYSLAELAIIRYGKNQKRVLSDTGRIPILGTGGLMGFATTALYDKPSVLIGRKGTIGKVKYIAQPFWTVDTLFYTIVNTDVVIPQYLYYLMSLLDLNKYNEGTTIPSLRIETLNKLEFEIPPLEKQKKVLSLLSPIDDKIELNNKINENLERQAQAIYREWFETICVDEMPLGWRVVALGDVAIISKKSFNPSKESTTMLEHYSIPAFDECRFPTFQLSTAVKSNKFIVENNCFMISKLNPMTKRVWKPYCLTKNAVCSTEFIVYKAKDSTLTDFLYTVIDSASFSDFMCSHVAGSTGSRQRTTPSDTLSFEFVLPSEDVLNSFQALVSPIYEQIRISAIENDKLKRLRDSLLPKLMSGEVNVDGILL